jgi:hypothetical protein
VEVLPYHQIRKPRKKKVPPFWKLMTQANFHGRGPPRKSCDSQLLKRRRASAQAGPGLAEAAAAEAALAGFIGCSLVRAGWAG